jgi:rubredoxin
VHSKEYVFNKGGIAMKFECPGCGVEVSLSDDYNDLWYCPFCTREVDFREEDDDDYDGVPLSVYEAADIWASNGKDEDYMFGYSEEELEDALDS